MLSRSTWACELKYPSVMIRKKYPSHAPRERVSWNFLSWNSFQWDYSHAPRERVSWNNQDSRGERVAYVTLHVSVWVEIFCLLHKSFMGGSRSTWACELKFDKSDSFINDTSHAPRERVSWNEEMAKNDNDITKSRSTWACELKWNERHRGSRGSRSRSTWACELK